MRQSGPTFQVLTEFKINEHVVSPHDSVQKSDILFPSQKLKRNSIAFVLARVAEHRRTDALYWVKCLWHCKTHPKRHTRQTVTIYTNATIVWKANICILTIINIQKHTQKPCKQSFRNIHIKRFSVWNLVACSGKVANCNQLNIPCKHAGKPTDHCYYNF